MFRTIKIISTLILIPFCILGTSYCYIAVAGDTSATSAVQGEHLDFYGDCSSNGKVEFCFAVDNDLSRDLTSGDIIISSSLVMDGDTSWPEGIKDAISGADGEIVINLPVVWPAPGSYLLCLFDNDSTYACDYFDIVSNPMPPLTISGDLFGPIIPPDNRLEDIVMIVESGYGVGITDSMGDWSMALPTGGFDSHLEIFDLNSYLILPGEIDYFIPDTNSVVTIPYQTPDAFLRITCVDQYGDPFERHFNIDIEDSIGNQIHRRFGNSEFEYGLISGEDYRINISDANYFDCLYPLSLDEDTISPFPGDTVEYDVVLHVPDSYAYAYIRISGSIPMRCYRFFIKSGDYRSIAFNNYNTGIARLPISTSLSDSVFVEFDDNNEDFPVPEGYVVWPSGNFALPGDTVVFQMMPEDEAMSVFVGGVVDQDSMPLPGELAIYLDDIRSDDSYCDTTDHGTFKIDVLPGEYQVRSSYDMLDFDPPYLYPNYGSSYFRVNLGLADSSFLLFPCYKANDSIYVYIDQDGGYPSRYKFRAENSIMGKMIRHSDTTENLQILPVSNDIPDPYYLYLALLDTPLPEDLYCEGPPEWNVYPGDTAFLNITPEQYYFQGLVRQAADEPRLSNYHVLNVITTDLASGTVYDTTKVRNDKSYYQALPDGIYRLKPIDYNSFLYKPFLYDSLRMLSANVYNLDFVHNTADCSLHVYLNGIPEDSLGSFIFKACGDSLYPHGYYVERGFAAGTGNSFNVMICDAEWTIYAPEIELYESSVSETTIVVDSETRSLSIAFDYTYTEIIEVDKPITFGLSKIYPNPFNSSMRIDYSIDKRTEISLEIYNVHGNKVKTLVDKEIDRGYYHTVWDGLDMLDNICSSGIYFVKLSSNYKEETLISIFVK